MKLLVVCPTVDHGGAERYAVTIAVAGCRRGWTVRAAVPYVDGTRQLVADFRAAGVPTADLTPAGPGPRGRRLTAGVRRFARLLRGLAPDVVHLTLTWPSAGFPELLTCALLGVPTVVVFQLVPDEPDLGRRVPLYRWARRRRQAWVAVSEHGRRVLARSFGVPVEELRHVYNGISSESRRREDGAAPTRRALGLPPESVVALAVGRLDPQKGHADLVNASFRLREDHPELRVLIAGQGGEYERLAELVRTHRLDGRVRLLGQVANVPDLMRAADLFVFPSHFEGTPFAMLEAMALGTPVIAARFGGAEEVIEADTGGLLVPVGDPEALASALDWAITHAPEMREMAAESRRRVDRFSERAMVDRTLALLSETARMHPGSAGSGA